MGHMIGGAELKSLFDLDLKRFLRHPVYLLELKASYQKPTSGSEIRTLSADEFFNWCFHLIGVRNEHGRREKK